jgi:transcriptional regulator with XRE-family HTH domain
MATLLAAPPVPTSIKRISRAVPRVRTHLGRRLRALRRARGLSQASLAAASGLSVRFLSRVERGHCSISVDSLYHVAVALRVPLALITQIDLARRPRRPDAGFRPRNARNP